MIDIQFDGVNELVKKLMSLKGKDAINTAIKKSIYVLQREAKIQTPVDTGILRNSYITEFDDLIGRLVNFREYGIYVHEGTKNYKGNPFMQRALDNTDSQITMIFSREYDLLLEQLK